MIRDAAEKLKINYSTAKTILRVHRIKKRILRVNKEKKFELFKVIHKDLKVEKKIKEQDKKGKLLFFTITYFINLDKCNNNDSISSTHETTESTVSKGGILDVQQVNPSFDLFQNVLKHTETAQNIYLNELANKSSGLEYARYEDQMNILRRMLTIYYNLKHEVEINNRVINDLLNLNLKNNLEKLAYFENTVTKQNPNCLNGENNHFYHYS